MPDEIKIPALKKTYMSVIAISAWVAVGLQQYILIDNVPGNGLTIAGAIERCFCFFTILSNTLVAVSLTASLVFPASNAGRFFSRATVQSAIAVYIVIVGLVYNIILRNLWSPVGTQLVADNLLHVIVPVLYFIYWLVFIPRHVLQWKNIIPWLIFPLCYLIYAMIRGHFKGEYPYPFLDVTQSGYAKVFMNSGLMLIAFLVVSSLFVAYNRAGKKKS